MAFDKNAYDSLMAKIDAEGLFEKAQRNEWQPEEDVLCVVDHVERDIRKDVNTQAEYLVCKPFMLIVEGTHEGKIFPLNRYGYSNQNEFSMDSWGRNASVIVGEPVFSATAADAAFEQAKADGIVLQVKHASGVSKSGKNVGKTWHSLDIVSKMAKA